MLNRAPQPILLQAFHQTPLRHTRETRKDYICSGGSSLHFQRAAALHQSHAHRYRARADDPSARICRCLVEGNFLFIPFHSPFLPHCNVQGEAIPSSIYTKFLVAPLHLTDAHRQQFPPTKFIAALARLSQAHKELEESKDWLQPKGVGVVCVKKGHQGGLNRTFLFWKNVRGFV